MKTIIIALSMLFLSGCGALVESLVIESVKAVSKPAGYGLEILDEVAN